jgi:rubrerythrin
MTIRGPESQAESRKWLARFSLRSMTALHVSRCADSQLTEKERSLLTKSIQQFQLGEGSKGQRLLERAKRFGQRIGDPLFADAIALLIKEEQQHSKYLEAFMESQTIPRVSKHCVDTIFRQLRGLAGLELSLTVLVTAEIIAVPYYRALRSATHSPTLKIICTRILEDEAKHLEFQASMLARVASNRPRLLQRMLAALHRLFLTGTIFIVWKEHRSAFVLAGYDFGKFKAETLQTFFDWSQCRRTWASRTLAHRAGMVSNFERAKTQS